MKTIFLTPAVFILLIVGILEQPAQAQTATAPSAGDGSSGNPYQIATLNNLYWISQNFSEWDKYYIQTADIDASETSGWSGGGWTPIGNNTTAYFTGSYNGQGFAIDALYINRSADYQGLFGKTSGAQISNLGVTSVNISANDKIGGLVGQNNNSTVVTNCYSTGNISGRYDVGGLMGDHIVSSSISGSYSTAAVSGEEWVGGLVGIAFSASVTNSYSKGNLTRSSGSGQRFGSFVGSLQDGAVQYCYSTGSVNFGTGQGFVYESAGSPTYTANFFDTQTSGQTSGTGATAKTTAEMKTASTFVGWDAGVWNIGDGINNGYPYLKWQNPGGTPLPVEMTSFTATAQRNSVDLRWNTATEVNNFGFDVERKNNANPAWTMIAFVDGSGTSNAPHEYAYVDNRLTPGTYAYRIRQTDRNGMATYSREQQVTVGSAPRAFSLSQNYPNPFNPSTTITFTIPNDGRVVLKVYDMLGRQVATLLDEDRKAGVFQQAVFDASRYSSGVYFAVLRSGGKQLLKKMVLLK